MLGAEILVASLLLDTEHLGDKRGLFSRWIADAGGWTVRAAVGFVALFAGFAYLKYGAALSAMRLRPIPVRRGLVVAHCIALACFAGLSAVLFATRASAFSPDAIAAVWLIAGIAVVLTIGLALFPIPHWAALLHSTENLWLYASGGAIAACAAARLSTALWRPTAKLTFYLVRFFLSPFASHIVTRPRQLEVGTNSFSVTIAPECSGLEGVGLLLIFSAFWLFLCRRDLRFPRALLLMPAALVVLFLLNSARIAALVLIGSAGAPDIAAGGFHSEAGWIAFNFVAFGTAITARRVRWFAAPSTERPQLTLGTVESSLTAAYLVPFLAIVAAGMVARALSGNFEWMYWLRFPAGFAALYAFRRVYAKPDWKPDWFAPAAGGAVFLLWIALDRLFVAPQPATIPALMAASPLLRQLWIFARISGAVAIVPIAEELAFRGYLLRRIVAADFENVSFTKISAWPMLGSSVVFGLLHGRLWFAGILAGLVYAWAARRRGRLGDAILAHAITNAFLAVYVLLSSHWYLW